MEESSKNVLAAELSKWNAKLIQLNEERREAVKFIDSLEKLLIKELDDVESGLIGNYKFHIDEKISARTVDISQVEDRFTKVRTSVDISKVKSWFAECGEVPTGIKITVQKKLSIEED